LLQTRQLPHNTKEKIHQARYATLYTRQQIRDSLNTLSSIIVILRNLEGTIRLNRMRSNPLEHLLGRTRMRCRDVSAMRLLMHGLSAEFSRLQGASVLHLIATPRGRTSFSIDCEQWTGSDRTPFSLDPMNIAARVFQLADLPIDVVYQSIDPIPMQRYVLEIMRYLVSGVSPIKLYIKIDRPLKLAIGRLSSNQLFRGVPHSPPRESLFRGKSDISESLRTAVLPKACDLQTQLERIF
jgi:hypothetical protein